MQKEETNCHCELRISYIATQPKFNQSRVYPGETHIKCPFYPYFQHTFNFHHSQYTIKRKFDMRFVYCFKK
jgi:hypothetical protein